MAPSAISQYSASAGVGKAVNSKSQTDDANAALDAAKVRFIERNPVSLQLHKKAVLSLPGGNTRTLLHTTPFPLFMKHGRGHQVFDEDGHVYTDFVGELTAGLYGHSHPVIRGTLVRTITGVGLNLGATTAQEARFAALLCSRFNLERVRFCNSGTEANLHALAGARRFTGKRKVVVFSGGYHGAVLSFGSGSAPNNVDQDDWIVTRYNDIESARHAIEGTEGVAAVLAEGMQGSGGCIPGTKEFLMAIQESAKKVGAVFILDEVMTSRLAPGGIQSVIGLQPDMTTLGKYLGGGMAFGAFGGREDIMSVYDPRVQDSLAHSGTFNNNTLAMHAGYAGLAHVYTPDVAQAFSANGDAFRQRLQEVTRGTKISFTGRGTLMAMHVSETGSKDIRCKEDVDELLQVKDLFWMEMLEEGFWTTRRGMIALILDTPQEELDRFVECLEAFVERHKRLVALDGC